MGYCLAILPKLCTFVMAWGSNHTMLYPGNSSLRFVIIITAFIARDNVVLTWYMLCTKDQLQKRSIDEHVLRRIQSYMCLLVCA